MTSRNVAATLLLSSGLILTATLAEAQDVLKPMTGRWKAILSYNEGGRFSMALAEDTGIKQLDQNTIGFSLKRMDSAAGPIFEVRLTRDVARNNYLVTVKTDKNPTLIERLTLSYTEAGGFSGEGTLKDVGGQIHKVQVKIMAKPIGEYEWSFSDPDGPPNNNLVFRFYFFKRI